MSAASRLAELLYPSSCVACRADTDGPAGLCAACFREAVFLYGAVCDLCGAPTPDGEADERLCDSCAHAPPGFDRGRAALLYDGVGRRIALQLKHADRLDLAKPAARWMLRAGEGMAERADVIAPVPMHWTRLIRRRSNQAAELARAIAKTAGKRGAFAPELLIRTRRTESQDGRTRAERFENVAGAFRLSRRGARKTPGANVLLVDDVMTTGATLTACAEVCRDAGAETVTALVLARVAREGSSNYMVRSDQKEASRDQRR